MRKAAACIALVAAGACVRDRTAPVVPEPAPPPAAERRVRPAAEAGTFYAADPDALRQEVRGYLAAAKEVSTRPVRMVLVPHAGLRYSGQVAAESFKQLAPGFRRAVVVAANHNGAARYAGTSVDRSTHYAVPGLEVKVAAAERELLSRPGFVDVAAAHANHMIEIELPFLHEANAGAPFELVPLVMGSVDFDGARRTAEELARLDEPGTVFVFSVDLSHYYTYEQAVALDRPCLAAIEQMDAEGTARCDVDGPQVLLTMVHLAAMRSLTPRLLTYRNSGDVPAGDRSRVVGYGALVFEDRFVLADGEQKELLRLARRSLETRVRDGRDLAVPPELGQRFPRLASPRGTFVTLKKSGVLRGCIGSLSPHRPLAQDVAENAVAAAVHDTRFEPVQPAELGAIDVSVSVLDLPRPLEGLAGDVLLAELGRTKPGVILELRGRRSTFLPEVWEELPEPAEFLMHLSRKQGSPPDGWRDADARFQTYRSQHFGEKP